MAEDNCGFSSESYSSEPPASERELREKITKLPDKIIRPKFIYDDLLGTGVFIDPDSPLDDLLQDIFLAIKNMNPHVNTKMQMFHTIHYENKQTGEKITKSSPFFVEILKKPKKKSMKKRLEKIEEDGVNVSRFNNWNIENKKLVLYLSKRDESKEESDENFDAKVSIVYFGNLLSKAIQEEILNNKNIMISDYVGEK